MGGMLVVTLAAPLLLSHPLLLLGYENMWSLECRPSSKM